VAIYFDEDVDPTITWVNSHLHYLWAYVKETYGDFGEDPRLYVLLHDNKYPGGRSKGFFDERGQNIIDVGDNVVNAFNLITTRRLAWFASDVSVIVECKY